MLGRVVASVSCLAFLCLSAASAQNPAEYAESFSPSQMSFLADENMLTAATPFNSHLLVKESGEGVLIFTAHAPTNWKNRESIVLRVLLDGRLQGHVVIFGETKTPVTYSTQLQKLERGKQHTVAIEWDARHSTVRGPGLTLQDIWVLHFAPEHPLFPVLRHSPIVYGRRGMNFNDTPLLMYHTTRREGDRREIEYHCIYSNENGGTGTRSHLLINHWGRTTDIELVSRVVLRTLPAAEPSQEDFFQGLGHKIEVFTGEKVDHHPLLQVVTDNSMLAPYQPAGYRLYLSQDNVVDSLHGAQGIRREYRDSYRSPTGYLSGYIATEPVDELRFFYAPLPTLSGAGSRERLLDRYPWTYEVMAYELEQEKKLELVASPATEEMSDPRHYFYIEFQGEQSPPRLGQEQQAGLFIGLKAGEDYYYSNHRKLRGNFRNLTGIRRTTVELPAQVRAKDISDVVVCLASGRTAYEVNEFRITKAFMLDEEYRPGTSALVRLRDSSIYLSSPDDPNKIRPMDDFQAFCTSLLAP